MTLPAPPLGRDAGKLPDAAEAATPGVSVWDVAGFVLAGLFQALKAAFLLSLLMIAALIVGTAAYAVSTALTAVL